MKKFGLFFLLLIIVSLLIGCSSSSSAKHSPVVLTPYTKFYALDGDTYIYDQFKGKTLAIQFWAGWCNFSKSAIRDFNKQAAEYANDPRKVFLAVSIDDSRDLLVQRIGQEKLNAVTHIFSGNGPDDEAYLAFGAPEIPAAVLVTPKGEILHQGKTIDLSVLEGG